MDGWMDGQNRGEQSYKFVIAYAMHASSVPYSKD